MGQPTIPKEVRDELELAAGTRLYVMVKNGEVVGCPKNRRLADLTGIHSKPPSRRSMTVEEWTKR